MCATAPLSPKRSPRKTLQMKALTLVASGAMVASRIGELSLYGSSLLAGAPCIHTPAAIAEVHACVRSQLIFERYLLSFLFAS
jgi:hypothetical protein